MKAETYKTLLKALQKLQKTLVASQIEAVRRDPAIATRLARLHNEAEVGGDLDDFVAATARRSTVLLLLRTVFVRVLEDLGILGLKRIRDEWGFAAFREVAPALGMRAYFQFIFRDLAADFPVLFAVGDDELALPNEDACREIWNLWHHPNSQGDFYLWNGDGFDSHFLGDLYQDLDADIRKHYALLQTPPFVEEYILDHTLTPALAAFDPRSLESENRCFRLLDPTCGSGHFLIGAFNRLANYWRDRHGFSEWHACEKALQGVWGCDINPHAVEIAEFRLLLEVVARTGETDLGRLAKLSFNVRTMDSLIPWERTLQQGELFPARDRLDAYSTPGQRRDNAAFLAREFHVVVGNPPYIQPRDARKAADYRAFWPNSCFKEFCLNAPFLERFLVLGSRGAFTGQITANNFAKRTFGKAVITKVLAKWQTSAVVDTSLAPIPGHGWKGGTSTVILFGRCLPFEPATVPWLLAKRRESAEVSTPALSQAWLAIKNADLRVASQGQYIDVQLREAGAVAVYPWDLRGQDGQDLVSAMESATDVRLASLCEGRIGSDVITRAPETFEWSLSDALRVGLPRGVLRQYGDGKSIRDWAAELPDYLLVPYEDQRPVEGANRVTVERALWRWRRPLSTRFVSGGVTLADRGLPFFSIPQVPWHKHTTKRVIVFPFVTTEPHFCLVEGDAWFKDSVKLMQLKPEFSATDWLSLLGALNTSASSFWLRGKFKGTGRVRELWEDWIQIDEKLGGFPVPKADVAARAKLANALVQFATARSKCSPRIVLASSSWAPESLATTLLDSHDRYLAITRQMVALQEELDWLAYRSYGLVESTGAIPDEESIEGLSPGHRPFEVALARRERDADDQERSAWWSRHGHERVEEIPSTYSKAQRALLQRRLDLIEGDVRLAMLETTTYKRAWQLVDWQLESKSAAESWLLDSMERLFAPATDERPTGPLAEPKPYRLEDIVAVWSRDPRVAAVAGAWAGTGLSIDLSLVAEHLLRANSLPDNPYRLYSADGLRHILSWKRVWALQDQEDAWEAAARGARAVGMPAPSKQLCDPDDPSTKIDSIPSPPKFNASHFLKPEFFTIRDKMNVTRERFILFADLSPNRFGWNGWRNRERALAQVGAFTLAEGDGLQPLPTPTSDDPRRCGVTLGLWESLSDVKRWGTDQDHGELQALAREACRQARCPCPVVEAWRNVVPTKANEDDSDGAGDSPDGSPSVSLAQRAWVASLFQVGKEFDLAAIWTRHLGRVSEPPQASLQGVTGAPVQLTIPMLNERPNKEHAGLDLAQVALILDDLVASGDLQSAGRGKRKLFQLVVRGTAS